MSPGHEPAAFAPSPLSNAHTQVAHTFFALSAARGFVVTGGAALIAHGAVDRYTDDLDLFTAPGDDLSEAARQLEAAAQSRSWPVQIHRSSPTFVRMSITVEGHELIVDLAVDAPPRLPATITVLGPTIPLEESGGQKTLALFGRAAPRDFVDVYELATRFGTGRLLDLAAERDPGFDPTVLADMIDSLDRLADSRLPIAADRISSLRDFYRDWASTLRDS